MSPKIKVLSGTGYEVGYGRPPRHTRFRPGQTGNPKGRPRKDTSLSAILERSLHKQVMIRSGGRREAHVTRRSPDSPDPDRCYPGRSPCASLILKLGNSRAAMAAKVAHLANDNEEADHILPADQALLDQLKCELREEALQDAERGVPSPPAPTATGTSGTPIRARPRPRRETEIMTSQNRALLDAALRDRLHLFVQKCCTALYPGTPFEPNWHIEAMCHQLERVRRGEVQRLLITVPPRYLKSMCGSVGFVAFCLGHDPRLKFLVASYGPQLAAEHARDFQKILEADWYKSLFPKMRNNLRKNTEMELITAEGGGRRALTLNGAITGLGADILIVDDLMKAADAHSPVERERVKAYYQDSLVSRLNDKRTGRIIVIQQRLHEDDLAGFLIANGNFEHLNLTAIAERDEPFDLPGGRRHRRSREDALHQQREPLETLDRIRREIGPAAFSAQYQQSPVPPGGNLIRWGGFLHTTPRCCAPTTLCCPELGHSDGNRPPQRLLGLHDIRLVPAGVEPAGHLSVQAGVPGASTNGHRAATPMACRPRNHRSLRCRHRHRAGAVARVSRDTQLPTAAKQGGSPGRSIGQDQ